MNPDPTALAALWSEYGDSALMETYRRFRLGDKFGASLAAVRGAVRREAAELLLASDDPLEAARTMHQNAGRYRITSCPIVDFDAAALDYTRARTWQDCARTLDPSLPELQPKWD